MDREQSVGKDEAYYEPLFEPILAKLEKTGDIELEIFIGELFPRVRARFDSDDVYEAMLRLAAQGLIRCDDSNGDTVIALRES